MGLDLTICITYAMHMMQRQQRSIPAATAVPLKRLNAVATSPQQHSMLTGTAQDANAHHSPTTSLAASPVHTHTNQCTCITRSAQITQATDTTPSCDGVHELID
jgi:hypothetical protein